MLSIRTATSCRCILVIESVTEADAALISERKIVICDLKILVISELSILTPGLRVPPKTIIVAPVGCVGLINPPIIFIYDF